MTGSIIQIDSCHHLDRVNPAGAGRFIDMSRLLVAYGKSKTDILWIAEEALRSGCVPVVIARIAGEVDLTAGRRLQLAAEAGKSLGLLIIPEGMGSNAAETRWHCNPVNEEAGEQFESTLYQLICKKNKTGTTGSWMVRWNETARHIDCLSQTGDRPLSQATTG